MSPEEMQQKSMAKVKQIFDLMNLLQVNAEPRERLTKEGFIEHIVYWVDRENYQTAAVPEEPKEEVATGENV